jgi:limonene-1,2-epoxide hydrolase
MTRILTCLLTIGAGLALATTSAHATPLAPAPARALVARFAEALDAGDAGAARACFAPTANVAVLDLAWRSWQGGDAVTARIDALIASGAHLASEPLAVMGEGAVVLTRDLLWADDLPDGLAPFRYTGIYVVDGDRIASLTWLLAAEQRDALAAAWLVGTWRWREASFYFRFDPDGAYRADSGPIGRDGREPQDVGTFDVVGGVLTIVSGPEARYCCPGQTGRYRLHFGDADRLLLELVDDACWTRQAPSPEPLTFDRIHAPEDR